MKRTLFLYLCVLTILVVWLCNVVIFSNFKSNNLEFKRNSNIKIINYNQDTQTQTKYARITTSAKLFASQNSTKEVCTLPISYYVKIISETSSGYLVEYAENSGDHFAFTGYIEKKYLTVKTPKNAPYYFNKTIPISNTTVQLKEYPLSTNIVISAYGGQQLAYYGEITTSSNEVWLFVSVNSKFGYVKKSDVPFFEVPFHQDYIDENIIPTTPDNPTNDDKDNTEITPATSTNNNMDIYLIIAICIPAILIVILLFKGNKPKYYSKKTHTQRKDQYKDYYDNDDEY